MPPSDRDSSVENVPVRAPGVPGILRRSLAKLLSSAHLVLSGTTASILVIIFLGSLFVFVALRNHHRDEIRAHTFRDNARDARISAAHAKIRHEHNVSLIQLSEPHDAIVLRGREELDAHPAEH